MNEVSITIPAQLYVDLYHIHGESSHKVIVECLRQLVDFENEEKNGALPNDLPGWPTRYTKAHKVWKIATQFLAESGSIIPLNNHKDLVLDACVNEGINRNTATTTYSNWRQFYLQTLE